MRKLALVVLFCAAGAGLALAQVPAVISKTFRQTYLSDGGVTDAWAVPTGACTPGQGVDLTGATSWQVIISADAGGVTTGTGAALCYYCGTVYSSGIPYTDVTKRWNRCSSTTFDVTPVASQRDTFSTQFTSGVGSGQIYYFPYAIQSTSGVDGGIDITIEVRRGK